MGFEDKTKKIIDELRRELENVLKHAKDSKEEVVEEVEKLITQLKGKGNKFNKDFENFKKENQETFDNIEGGLKQATGEVKKIFKDAFNKFK